MSAFAELAREARSPESSRAALDAARELLDCCRRKPAKRPASVAASEQAIRSFYNSWQWKRLRYSALKERGRRCECCGATAADGAKVCVDHIKPVRCNWSRRLDPDNLQVLCDGCNRGKGSHDETRWAGAVAARGDQKELAP